MREWVCCELREKEHSFRHAELKGPVGPPAEAVGAGRGAAGPMALDVRGNTSTEKDVWELGAC